jgi:hypothetical protein
VGFLRRLPPNQILVGKHYKKVWAQGDMCFYTKKEKPNLWPASLYKHCFGIKFDS